MVDIGVSNPPVKTGQKIIWLTTSKPMLFLGALWMLMHIFLYHRYGIQIVFDSHRYIAYANSVMAGSSDWLQADSVLYASYTLFLFIVLHVLQQPIEFVITLQVLLSGVATIFLYKTFYNATNHRMAAFIGVALYLLWPQIHSWSFYIHTESLYISVSILILYFISKAPQNKNSLIAIALILCFAIFLRPNGFFLLLGVIAGFTSHISNSFKRSRLYLIAAFVALILTYSANFALEIYSPFQYLNQGQVIQGYNSLTINISPLKAASTGPALLHIFNFIKEQPLDYFRLLLLRFSYLWGQVRPYYSTIHNIAIVIFFFPVFLLALRGLRKAFRGRTPTFIIVVSCLQTIMAMVIAVDWDNRFVVPLLPFVFYFASIGLTSLRLFKHIPKKA